MNLVKAFSLSAILVAVVAFQNCGKLKDPEVSSVHESTEFTSTDPMDSMDAMDPMDLKDPVDRADPLPEPPRLIQTQKHLDRRVDEALRLLLTRVKGNYVGSLRKFIVRKGKSTDKWSRDYTGSTPNSTAACKTIRFLTLYSDRYPQKSRRTEIESLIRLVLSLKSTESTKLHFNAIALSSKTRTYSAFGNAICGNALLEAGSQFNVPSWTYAAVDIADFLLRLQDPSSHYKRRHGLDVSGRSTEDGIYDLVRSDDTLETTMTVWNLYAAYFLDEVYRKTKEEKYKTASVKIVRHLAPGALEGYDYYATAGFPRSPLFNITWDRGYHDLSYADGKFHRQGDLKKTGTVGTDQFEYGLYALHKLKYDSNKLVDAYKRFSRMKFRSPDGPCSSRFDGRISFGGYFRLYSKLSQNNHSYGCFYDTVGMGILLHFKKELVPEDYQRSIEQMRRFELNNLAANTNANFTPYKGSKEYSVGIIPIAVIASAILETTDP